ncbi:hypothetical protein C7974DRAFT_122320 [Boeremia exigua]|uniref:uncharacterized protein n=1 Tax=Boeremia exigua TaxID=749465 RepID=UPI001E8E2238|nr:uncharacterized protein C7974DRAFT_122320 [Boeremia exigua]KAH6638843.1 hypothetical protein C7974DRAFT_122320 [Boeremia exigua]
MICVFIICLWVYSIQVLGYPIPIRPTPSVDSPGDTQCASIDTYTVEWFLREASRRKDIDLPLDNALFYTRGMSDMAQEYACDHDLITIWSIWDRALYNHRNVSTNAMRCIHNDQTKRQRFFASMSEAYATLATGTVVVMHDANDWMRPPTDGIWHQVEYQTMVHNAKTVTTILKLKEKDNASALVLWDRALPPLSELGKPISEVLATGRHVPHFLGNAMDWIAGAVESARQAVLDQEQQPHTGHTKTACSGVSNYPLEIHW